MLETGKTDGLVSERLASLNCLIARCFARPRQGAFVRCLVHLAALLVHEVFLKVRTGLL